MNGFVIALIIVLTMSFVCSVILTLITNNTNKKIQAIKDSIKVGSVYYKRINPKNPFAFCVSTYVVVNINKDNVLLLCHNNSETHMTKDRFISEYKLWNECFKHELDLTDAQTKDAEEKYKVIINQYKKYNNI